jgi:hypothetical protein
MSEINWNEEVPKFYEEYPEMVKLTDQQKRVLKEGPQAHEGMVFGKMYADWKKRKGLST